MTSPRTPSPLEGALLLDQGRGLLGLYQSLCRPTWLELLAPRAAAALDDPMQSLERLLARFADPAWEAEGAVPPAGDEQPSAPAGKPPLRTDPRQPAPTGALHSPAQPPGAVPALKTFSAAHTASPEVVLQPPRSGQKGALAPRWAPPQVEDDRPEPSPAVGRNSRRSFSLPEEELNPLLAGEDPAIAHLEPIRPGARLQTNPAPLSRLSREPGAPHSATPSPQPEIPGASSAPGAASPSSGAVRLVTAPGRLSSLLQASLRPRENPVAELNETSSVRLNEQSTNLSMNPAEVQNPFNPFSKSVVSSLPSPDSSFASLLPRETHDPALLQRLVDEQFDRWLEGLELAYLRTYGTSGS